VTTLLCNSVFQQDSCHECALCCNLLWCAQAAGDLQEGTGGCAGALSFHPTQPAASTSRQGLRVLQHVRHVSSCFCCTICKKIAAVALQGCREQQQWQQQQPCTNLQELQ
jgi:hypothetical protein